MECLFVFLVRLDKHALTFHALLAYALPGIPERKFKTKLLDYSPHYSTTVDSDWSYQDYRMCIKTTKLIIIHSSAVSEYIVRNLPAAEGKNMVYFLVL